ncbi:LacI family DNA-binding transcriptional regulator [Rhizobium sp. SSA_523]|uniref:LacI family DNA-binding transcriptional regulator n=1 Tax=Rhizobium sp. SSA_523 TaxID=2952477 RepID=UPI0020903A1F|nr:LacI family DNA-binding transcriptional regulator [Rhizobium sp. SSA_523]MCO5731004.1 LacI family transcriptional regulator [Rhizobium sp. SSA_523]WKC24191.1 LacI family DNA-binding transcriptional regulator [Rhizobium sp. SSA_523]
MRLRRGRSERTTLHDVADKAGVSAITVSRALREPEKVSPALRARILDLITEMDYVPDQAAQALASRHNSTFGVLTASLTSRVFLSFMQGVEERVRDTSFRIQYANTHNSLEEEKRQVRLLLSQNTAGIVLGGVGAHEDVAEMIDRASCPVVQVVDVELKTGSTAIALNHFKAAAAATRHLLDCGYRRIAILGGLRGERSRRRIEGYAAILSEAGLYDPALVHFENASASTQMGARLLARALKAAPDIDAVFCQSDDIALGALFQAQRMGRRVPEDLGICGYNDLDFAAVMEPPLTTVRTPLFEMGYRAADLMIGAASGRPLANQVIDLGFQLIERQTTRPRQA